MPDPLQKAAAALTGPLFDCDPAEPYAAAILRARRAFGRVDDPRPLLDRWAAVTPGELRYRWPVSHARIALPSWAGTPKEWTPWRAAEKQLEVGPFDYEVRFSLPAILTECAELLCELSADPDPQVAQVARRMLADSEPALRRDFATFIQAAHAWTDTFALWCLVRRPGIFARLHPFAFAIATCYAATAQGSNGIVLGTRFPFHGIPMVSASGQLATGLLALGHDLPLVASLVGFVAGQAKPSGGWCDGDGPEDVLATLVAADLLLHIDPHFDPQPTVAFLSDRQLENGGWKIYGPEQPWLTGAIVEWLADLPRSFAERFRWPHLPAANRDHKTGLPSFAWFSDLTRLFAALPGLAKAPVELAFIDLAGFREFNNANGQERGDAVLHAFAQTIAAVPAAAAIRDGGDEFLLVGAPTRTGLAHDLDAMRRGWPQRFRALFGNDVPPVVARIVVIRTKGDSIEKAREELGRAISPFKHKTEKPGPEGVLLEID